MPDPRILLVDDDEVLRLTLSALLSRFGFTVVTAGSVAEALHLIHSAMFDVLITDLHMPGAGDGLTVISAMRHTHPGAVTLLLSAFPEMAAATQALVLQVDEVLVKPMDIAALVNVIHQRLARGPNPSKAIDGLAGLLERNFQGIIKSWSRTVQDDKRLQSVDLNNEQRCMHLPQQLREMISRLRSDEPLARMQQRSRNAYRHGVQRRHYGYTAAQLVEEAQILQACIFQTVLGDLQTVDFSAVLPEVMVIADEVDSQLTQSMEGFSAALLVDALTA